MNAFRANAAVWIAGTVAAVGGALLVRFVSPLLAPGHARLAAGVSVAGHILTLAGLAAICIGVSRRVRRESALLDAAPPESSSARPSGDDQ